MLNDTLKGLIVTLPDTGVGVVISSTRQGSDLYKLTAVSNTGLVYVMQAIIDDCFPRENVTCKDYVVYDPQELASIFR